MTMETLIQSAVETAMTQKFTNTENQLANLYLLFTSLDKSIKEILHKANPEEKLTTRQAAELLKTKENTVRDYCKKDKIKYEKIGNQYRIKRSEITKYLNRN
jgi:excisionase family DNA binding protein